MLFASANAASHFCCTLNRPHTPRPPSPRFGRRRSLKISVSCAPQTCRRVVRSIALCAPKLEEAFKALFFVHLNLKMRAAEAFCPLPNLEKRAAEAFCSPLPNLGEGPGVRATRWRLRVLSDGKKRCEFGPFSLLSPALRRILLVPDRPMKSLSMGSRTGD